MELGQDVLWVLAGLGSVSAVLVPFALNNLDKKFDKKTDREVCTTLHTEIKDKLDDIKEAREKTNSTLTDIQVTIGRIEANVDYIRNNGKHG